MRRFAAATLLAALVITGCGGDDEDEADSTTTEASTSEAAGDSETTAPEGTDPTDGTEATDPTDATDPVDGSGACPYLSTAALDDAFGTTFAEDAGTETGCAFSDDEGLSVQVSRIDVQIDPETYAEQSTESCEDGTLVDVDAGDRAYACIAIGPTASYFEGSVLVNLSVLSADDEQAVVDAFVQVLPSVTVPA